MSQNNEPERYYRLIIVSLIIALIIGIAAGIYVSSLSETTRSLSVFFSTMLGVTALIWGLACLHFHHRSHG
jgi:ABC-type phosphate transport system permease subunit